MAYTAIVEARKDAEAQMKTLREAIKLRNDRLARRADQDNKSADGNRDRKSEQPRR